MAIFAVGRQPGFALGPMFAMFLLSFSGLDSIYGVIVPGTIAAIFFLILTPRFKEIVKEKSSNRKKQKINAISSGNNKVSLILLIIYVTVRSWVHAGLVYFIPFYFPAFRDIADPEYLVIFI